MKRLFFALLGVLASLTVLAQGVPDPMPGHLVHDFAGILGNTQPLEDSLLAYEKRTSNQITVVTIENLGSMSPAEYAMQVGRQWGVGQKDKRNGVVILIKPRNKFGRGEVNMAIGQGLEGALPDSRVGRIIDDYMMPALKQGDFYTAAYNGAMAVERAIGGEFSAEEEGEIHPLAIGAMILVFFVFFIILIIIISKNEKKNGGDGNNGSGGGGFWVPPIILGGMGRGGSSGGGFGGGGGGGFGGFGGGSFGGGGGGRSF